MIWVSPYNKPANPLTGEEGVEIIDPRPIPPGPVGIRYALGSSLNIPAVRAVELMGIEPVIRTANKMGYTTMGQEDLRVRRYGPAIATGGANLNLFEHTYAFATLANNGEMRGQRAVRNYGDGMRKIDPTTILRVNTERSNILYQFDNGVREQVVPANYAYLVTSILSDCNARYIIWTCGSFDIGRPYAVKTGTQQGLQKDRQGRETVLYNWQMGYTPDVAVGVWVGNQNNQPVNGGNFETANAANAIWKRVMQAATRDLPPRPFTEPPGIERARTLVGRPGSFNCSATYDEIWAAGDVKPPQEQCRLINSQRPNNAPAVSPTPSAPRINVAPNPAPAVRPAVTAPNPATSPPPVVTQAQPVLAPAPQAALPAPPTNPAPVATGPPQGISVAPGVPPPAAPTPITLVTSGQQPGVNWTGR
jgi:membrane peptidoglycan carboxypeptidase